MGRLHDRQNFEQKIRNGKIHYKRVVEHPKVRKYTPVKFANLISFALSNFHEKFPFMYNAILCTAFKNRETQVTWC